MKWKTLSPDTEVILAAVIGTFLVLKNDVLLSFQFNIGGIIIHHFWFGLAFSLLGVYMVGHRMIGGYFFTTFGLLLMLDDAIDHLITPAQCPFWSFSC